MSRARPPRWGHCFCYENLSARSQPARCGNCKSSPRFRLVKHICERYKQGRIRFASLDLIMCYSQSCLFCPLQPKTTPSPLLLWMASIRLKFPALQTARMQDLLSVRQCSTSLGTPYRFHCFQDRSSDCFICVWTAADETEFHTFITIFNETSAECAIPPSGGQFSLSLRLNSCPLPAQPTTVPPTGATPAPAAAPPNVQPPTPFPPVSIAVPASPPQPPPFPPAKPPQQPPQAPQQPPQQPPQQAPPAPPQAPQQPPPQAPQAPPPAPAVAPTPAPTPSAPQQPPQAPPAPSRPPQKPPQAPKKGNVIIIIIINPPAPPASPPALPPQPPNAPSPQSPMAPSKPPKAPRTYGAIAWI